MLAHISFVLSQITRLTDGETDGRTAFWRLHRVACNAHSAVKSTGLSACLSVYLFNCSFFCDDRFVCMYIPVRYMY